MEDSKCEKTTYFFNPENDLALAYGGENYTPPPMAMQLRADLQMLPIWYAEDGYNIYAPNEKNAEWIEDINEIFGININIVSINELQKCVGGFSPWGWSADTRKRLMDNNVKIEYLPLCSQIEKLRDLSHRRISIEIMEELNSKLDFEITPSPKEVCSFEKIVEWAKIYPKCFVKAPWSSSGKGIFRVLDVEAVDFERWCRGILKRQKSVICEVPFDVIMDFAMEFECTANKCRFIGYSVFRNDRHCSFDRGLVAPTNILMKKLISKGAKEEDLNKIKYELEEILTKKVAPHYNGKLGVDMLICNQDGKIVLDPCVELNLRMTMGAVTSIIGERYICENSCGEFKIEYHKKPFDVKNYIMGLESKSPVEYENGRIKNGCQILTPIYDDMRYCCYLQVNSGENGKLLLESF